MLKFLFCSSLLVLIANNAFGRVTSNSPVTFKNVNITGYSVFTKKFGKNLKNAENLQDHLPELHFDRIDIVDQNVPVLYKNSISNIENLDELIMENCNLMEIEVGALTNLPQLRSMSLKHNKLEEIPSGIFDKLPLLSTLDLNHNQIATIVPDAFDHMPSILNINLADNLMATWDKDWFKDTPLLTRLSFQNNTFEKLPNAAFRNLAGEKRYGSVDLTVNLIFSYNRINTIEPKAFADLEKINNLWLDNNELDEFDENLLSNTEVNDLRLNSNQIKCFNGDLAKIFKAKTTHIDGNPFDCACLDELNTWVEKNDKFVIMHYSKMTCDAERLRRKMDALRDRLKELNSSN